MNERNLMNEYPMATLAQSPRILLEEADVIEACASGMGERKMSWAAMEAAGLRYLAALVQIGDYATAYAVTNEWSLAQRSVIPSPVFTFMGAAFRRNNS
jgi:hypothetical protein